MRHSPRFRGNRACCLPLAQGDARQLVCNASTEAFLGPPTLSRRTADASCGCLDLFDHEEATISLVLSHERATEEHLSRKGPFVKQADPGDSDVAIWSG
jgi:hypothetical protein